jgi:tetratricopeptide (TPR) repeat protein
MDDAIFHYQEALRINSNDAEAHFNLGNALRQKGRMTEAIAQYQEAVRIQPNYVKAQGNLGKILLQTGKADEALQHFQKALESNPNSPRTRYNLGLCFYRLGRMDEAIAQYQKALQMEPADAAVLNSLAWLLATCPNGALRNGHKAVQLARQANALTSGKNPVMLHTLAAALAEAGQFPEAVETAQHALSLAEAQSNTMLAGALQSEIKLYQAGLPVP